jgi:hypothetical protein
MRSPSITAPVLGWSREVPGKLRTSAACVECVPGAFRRRHPNKLPGTKRITCVPSYREIDFRASR